jgi:MFS family permease
MALLRQGAMGERVPQVARSTNLALAVVAAGVFVAALDQTMVVTVLPSILRDLHIPFTRLDDAAWIVTGYLLGYTVAMPLFGRMADVHGRRLMYLVALAIFAGGSVLCLLAGGLQSLVAARIIQAAGGGAVVPIAMALSADLLPTRRLAFAVGLIGAAGEAGGVLGPLYGATLAHLWGWRSIFLVNVPLALVLAAACWWALPRETRRPRGADSRDGARCDADPAVDEDILGAEPGDRPRERVDYLGAALLAAALAGLTIGLGSNTQTGSVPVRPWWLVAGAAAFAGFIVWELRARQPLVRLSLFRERSFAAANVANLAVGAALIIGMVEIPLYAYSLLGMNEISGGLLLLRMTVMIPVGALVGGAVAGRLGYRATGVAGFALIAGGPNSPATCA